MSRLTQLNLKNGVTIIFAPIHHLRASVTVGFLGGSSHDHPLWLGEHHFLEHVVYGASRRLPRKRFLRQMERLTSVYRPYTYTHVTVFEAGTNQRDLSAVLRLLGESFLAPRVWTDHVDNELTQIVDELTDGMDSPEERLDEQFDRLMFDSHVLGRNSRVELKTIKRLNARRLFQLAQRVLTGRRCVVVISGRFHQAEIKAVIQKSFGCLRRGSLPRPIEAPTPQPSRIIRFRQEDNQKIQFWLGFPTFPFNDPDRIVLAALRNHLSCRDTSLLKERFVDQKLGYDAPSDLLCHWPMSGQYAWYASVDRDRFPDALRAINHELHVICTDLISTNDLVTTQKNLQHDLEKRFSEPEYVTQFYARQWAALGRIITPREYLRALRRVTPHQLRRVARRIFVHKRLILLAQGPLRGITRAEIDRLLRWRR